MVDEEVPLHLCIFPNKNQCSQFKLQIRLQSGVMIINAILIHGEGYYYYSRSMIQTCDYIMPDEGMSFSNTHLRTMAFNFDSSDH